MARIHNVAACSHVLCLLNREALIALPLINFNNRPILLQVRPYAKAPADGEVIDGSSFVDESMITGESAPVAKRAGSPVISGALPFSSSS